MIEADEADWLTERTGDIFVSAYPEQLDSEDSGRGLWAFCLRIENNSGKRICLTGKDFRVTDSRGNSCCYFSQGFHGELPDLEPGECFEYENTATFEGNAAVLYGFCEAVDSDGRKFKIRLPVMQLTAGLGKSRPVCN